MTDFLYHILNTESAPSKSIYFAYYIIFFCKITLSIFELLFNHGKDCFRITFKSFDCLIKIKKKFSEISVDLNIVNYII